MVEIRTGVGASVTSGQLIGQTIGDLRANSVVMETLSLTGEENFEIRDSNGEFNVASDSTVLSDGDVVRALTRAAGQKG